LSFLLLLSRRPAKRYAIGLQRHWFTESEDLQSSYQKSVKESSPKAEKPPFLAIPACCRKRPWPHVVCIIAGDLPEQGRTPENLPLPLRLSVSHGGKKTYRSETGRQEAGTDGVSPGSDRQRGIQPGRTLNSL
jgi:hypothetical protein